MLSNTIMLNTPPVPQSSADGADLPEAGFPLGRSSTCTPPASRLPGHRRPRAGVSLTGSERAGKAIARGRRRPEEGRANWEAMTFIVASADDLMRSRGRRERSVREQRQICNGAKRFIIIDSLYDEF